MLVDRSIGHSVFIDTEPDQQDRLNSGCVKSEEVKRGDSVPEQFQHCGRRSQSCGSKMNRQQGAMQKPRGNRRRANQHAGISRKQSPEDRRTKNEDAGRDAQYLIEAAGENLMGVQFERDQTRNGAGAERAENPGAHRHGRSMFKNAQHVQKEVGAAEIHDEQNR